MDCKKWQILKVSGNGHFLFGFNTVWKLFELWTDSSFRTLAERNEESEKYKAFLSYLIIFTAVPSLYKMIYIPLAGSLDNFTPKIL